MTSFDRNLINVQFRINLLSIASSQATLNRTPDNPIDAILAQSQLPSERIDCSFLQASRSQTLQTKL